SSFCLMELGAAWAKAHKTLPVVVPPVSFENVTKTLGLKQAWNITTHSGLIDLRTLIREKISFLEDRSDHTWEKKRGDWKVSLNKVLKNLQPAKKVDLAEHEEAVAAL